MADSSAVNYPKFRIRSDSDKFRRIFDVVVAATALTVFAPVMIFIVIAIWCESGSPLFFRQIRLGQHGRYFAIYKFRKFHRNCGTDGSPLTLEQDPRMTVVGNFLRASKLDELPQFWNVILGDMSIIGPRPETPVFADCFSGGFERVLDHKPGILGPSQAIFRNESALFPEGQDATEFYRSNVFPAKARVDLDYYQNRTLISDATWILRGILAIFGRVPAAGSERGAERLVSMAPKPALARSRNMGSGRNET